VTVRFLTIFCVVCRAEYVPIPLDVASGVPAPRAAAPCLQRHLAFVELGPRQPPVVNGPSVVEWEGPSGGVPPSNSWGKFTAPELQNCACYKGFDLIYAGFPFAFLGMSHVFDTSAS